MLLRPNVLRRFCTRPNVIRRKCTRRNVTEPSITTNHPINRFIKINLSTKKSNNKKSINKPTNITIDQSNWKNQLFNQPTNITTDQLK